MFKAQEKYAKTIIQFISQRLKEARARLPIKPKYIVFCYTPNHMERINNIELVDKHGNSIRAFKVLDENDYYNILFFLQDLLRIVGVHYSSFPVKTMAGGMEVRFAYSCIEDVNMLVSTGILDKKLMITIEDVKDQEKLLEKTEIASEKMYNFFYKSLFNPHPSPHPHPLRCIKR